MTDDAFARGYATLLALDAMPREEAAESVYRSMLRAAERQDVKIVVMLISLLARYDPEWSELLRQKMIHKIKTEMARRAVLN